MIFDKAGHCFWLVCLFPHRDVQSSARLVRPVFCVIFCIPAKSNPYSKFLLYHYYVCMSSWLPEFFILWSVTCFKEFIRVRHLYPISNTHCKLQINVCYGFYFTLCNFHQNWWWSVIFAVYWVVTVLIVTGVSRISVSIFYSPLYLSFIINCCDLVWLVWFICSSVQSHVWHWTHQLQITIYILQHIL